MTESAKIAVPPATLKTVEELVTNFRSGLDTFCSPSFQEESVRIQFINKFFKALGWDVDNDGNFPESIKPVVHMYSQRVAGSTKRPDYAFRFGRDKKFFVEAKKPTVDLSGENGPAYQARLYSYNDQLPITILTNFREFAVYDYRITSDHPSRKDPPEKGRRDYFTYDQYLDRLDYLYGIFSFEAVKQLNFDRYVDAKPKKIRREVDEEFLQTIEEWRKLLALDLARENLKLFHRELNFAVQATIDRIIFLRMAEDRGIEQEHQLESFLSGPRIYNRLMDLFQKCDRKYNSGLFNFDRDRLSPKLKVDDKVLKKIISGLYGEDCPYMFSAWDADILGSVYERFLGSVIHLTQTHQARVEQKPEVKKDKGVYYTPKYIVDYIVKNTVGKLIENKTPKEISKIKILDPACGSGSFLVGAFQELLDHHLDWYSKHDPDKWRKEMEKWPDGQMVLKTKEKKRILLNNIFGVDIDSQAVEVTKLSLLLKILENETKESLIQMNLFGEPALPDLESNIKCGNSLIGNDFYKDQQMSFFDDETRYKINAFDWKRNFWDIFEKGGFDIVIGNPPYGYMIPDIEKDYFSKRYLNQDYQKDLYLLFLEKYSSLLKTNGLLGVIVSNTWMLSITFQNIRKYVTNAFKWERILTLPEKVFKATVDTQVLIFKKAPFDDNCEVKIDIRWSGKISSHQVLSGEYIPKDGSPINIIASQEAKKLYKKIVQSSLPLSEYCKVFNGVKPFEVGKGNPPQTKEIAQNHPYVSDKMPSDSKKWMPLLRGTFIQKYRLLWSKNYYIKYGPWLAAPRDPSIFEASEKIMVRQTGDSIIATIIGKGFVARNNLHIILPSKADVNLRYILAVMNSQLMDFCYVQINPEKGEALAEVKLRHVEQLPIYKFNFSNPFEKSRHDQIVSLVDQMLKLNKRLSQAKTPDEQTRLERELKATDDQIDRLVYELYGLTQEEIAIVEQSYAK